MAYNIDQIVKLRRSLHKTPEISGGEQITSRKILDFLYSVEPDRIFTEVFGEAVIAEFDSKAPGPVILFRCDMDAVPVKEDNKFEYKSAFENNSHACGHDGHMAMVLGLASILKENPINKGKVLLLFQPSEEVGTGAQGTINWLEKQGIKPDSAFAIHNLPGYPKGSIITATHTFSSASTGLIVALNGKQSHAAYPEKGINPALAIAELIQEITSLSKKDLYSDFVLATIVSVCVGERAFGTSPGAGELMVTLRSFGNSDMQNMEFEIQKLVQSISEKYALVHNLSYTDEFPASVCDPGLTKVVNQIAEKIGYPLISINKPNRWGEDFAYFTQKYPSVIFGIGAGESHPYLHTESYDFPDDILPVGIHMMDSIVNLFLRDNNSYLLLQDY